MKNSVCFNGEELRGRSKELFSEFLNSLDEEQQEEIKIKEESKEAAIKLHIMYDSFVKEFKDVKFAQRIVIELIKNMK